MLPWVLTVTHTQCRSEPGIGGGRDCPDSAAEAASSWDGDRERTPASAEAWAASSAHQALAPAGPPGCCSGGYHARQRLATTPDPEVRSVNGGLGPHRVIVS